MNWLAWLIIALAVVMVVGPVMMVRPTAGQARTARLRAQAQREGFLVSIAASRPGVDSPRAVYMVPLIKAPGDDVRGEWRLERKRYRHDLHFWQDWDWFGDERASAAGQSALKSVLDSLPPGASAMMSNRVGLAVEWDERCAGREPLALLRELKQVLTTVAEAG